MEKENEIRQRLLAALDDVIADHSVATTPGMVRAIRRRFDAAMDPELEGAIIRAQFLVASRGYLLRS